MLFLAGGYDETGVLNDVWGSAGGSTWALLAPSAPWAARSGHALLNLQVRIHPENARMSGRHGVQYAAQCVACAALTPVVWQ